ncbi:MAG: hypothetical protein AAB803_02990 [Patescibacteria group bacterium]
MENLQGTDIETAIKKNSYSIEIGGKSEAELERALTKNPFSLGDYARDMMHSLDFGTLAKSREIRVAKLRLGDLGFTGYPTIAHIFEQAPKLGLELLPAEAGPHARLQDRNQRSGDWYYIAMNPITDRNGSPDVFEVARYEDALWLHSPWAGPGDHWSLGNAFVFGLRK